MIQALSALSFLHFVLMGVVVIQMAVFFLLFLRIFIKSKKVKKAELSKISEPVSIIIATRNQVDLLQKNLPVWLDMDYPDYQVVVVNDGSWDETGDYLKEMEALHPRLKHVHLQIDERYHKGKKFAITMGIKAAKHEWMLFTDTDCTPCSKNWISAMMSARKSETELVLGYSPYSAQRSVLNWFVRYETFLTAQQYLSMAMIGFPYMGVGRNLLYKKELFFRYKGFASHQHILSGDDDLFVNETSNSQNTAVALHPDSFVISEPKNSFSAWVAQKSRHLSTGKFYKIIDRIFLGAWTTLQLAFYLLLITGLLVDFGSWPIWLALYGFRLMLQLSVYGMNMSALKSIRLLPLIPLLDPAMMVYYLTIGLDGLFSNPRTWKG